MIYIYIYKHTQPYRVDAEYAAAVHTVHHIACVCVRVWVCCANAYG